MSEEDEVAQREPLVAHVPLDQLIELLGAARECGEDLAAHVDDAYPGRAEQPVQARRHKRDMEPVCRLMSAIGHVASIPALSTMDLNRT